MAKIVKGQFAGSLAVLRGMRIGLLCLEPVRGETSEILCLADEVELAPGELERVYAPQFARFRSCCVREAIVQARWLAAGHPWVGGGSFDGVDTYVKDNGSGDLGVARFCTDGVVGAVFAHEIAERSPFVDPPGAYDLDTAIRAAPATLREALTETTELPIFDVDGARSRAVTSVFWIDDGGVFGSPDGLLGWSRFSADLFAHELEDDAEVEVRVPRDMELPAEVGPALVRVAAAAASRSHVPRALWEAAFPSSLPAREEGLAIVRQAGVALEE